MTTEQKGQYYFTPDETGNFSVQERPLGITPQPSLGQRFIRRIYQAIGIIDIYQGPRLEDLKRDPDTYEEMKILHDALLADLKSKGILDVVERLTNIPQEEWYDDENPPDYDMPQKKRENAWDVDITGPTFDHYLRPNPYGGWGRGNCTKAYSVPRAYITIQLQTGEEWDERMVQIRYDRSRNLTVAGQETSEINLNGDEDMRYLFGEHLRDAMNNPYNPYYKTEGGFLSHAAFMRHLHELNVAREKEYAAA